MDKRFINKEKTALWISEVFGGELPPEKLHRYKLVDGYLFFKCEEKYLYAWQWGDYCGDNPTMVFIINVGNIYAELEDEWDYKEFCWKKDSLDKLVKDYNKPYIISNIAIKNGRELTYYCKDGSTYKIIKENE